MSAAPPFRSFVVNLDGSEGRLAAFATQMAAQDLPWARVAAVDGRRLTPAEAARVDDAACRRYMGRSLQPGEIGCCLSHLRALERFLATDADVACLFEDDAALAPGFRATAEAAAAAVLGGDAPRVVNLGPSRAKYHREVAALPGGAALHQAFYFPMLATGVLWSRPAAAAFLRDCAAVTLPHDNRLRVWLTGTPHGFAVLPGVVAQSQAFGSDIERANLGAKRGALRRSPFYFLFKQRRLWGEKLRAMRAMRRAGPVGRA